MIWRYDNIVGKCCLREWLEEMFNNIWIRLFIAKDSFAANLSISSMQNISNIEMKKFEFKTFDLMKSYRYDIYGYEHAFTFIKNNLFEDANSPTDKNTFLNKYDSSKDLKKVTPYSKEIMTKNTGMTPLIPWMSAKFSYDLLDNLLMMNKIIHNWFFGVFEYKHKNKDNLEETITENVVYKVCNLTGRWIRGRDIHLFPIYFISMSPTILKYTAKNLDLYDTSLKSSGEVRTEDEYVSGDIGYKEISNYFDKHFGFTPTLYKTIKLSNGKKENTNNLPLKVRTNELNSQDCSEMILHLDGKTSIN